ncbi:metallophosphoesterase family protein [Paenibacillus sp. JCM 10914]|uniref:metallophosphoesterase n=1 Tax=Paenibacillus sp. JCM 10914 TaxID=1236974 RepID=UPI0003CC31FC|nr:metallophosphoesterase [Paenibacillus sp. JCM 10914]GAE04639.1 hypothetical protein JCM10914_693 [Paenibacillus sp. JCM 10914]
MSVWLWGAGLFVSCVLAAMGWMRAEASGYRPREEEVVSERVPLSFDGYRILFISDIHRRKLSEESLRRTLPEIDCIVLGGDVTEKGVPIERLRHNLNLLQRIAPSYAVLGNHDLYAGQDAVLEAMKDAGVIALRDQTVILHKGNDSVGLTGIKQPASKNRPYTNFQGQISLDMYHILVVHDPIWLQGRKETCCDLLLAGHTHGGQIVLPLVGAFQLERFYHTYKSGWYSLRRLADMSRSTCRMLISRGFGTSHIPLRLNCPAEYHVITLRQKP